MGTCGNCEFWIRDLRDSYQSYLDDSGYYQNHLNERGSCHLYPPKVKNVDVNITTYWSKWPKTDEDEWCGKWKPKKLMKTNDAVNGNQRN